MNADKHNLQGKGSDQRQIYRFQVQELCTIIDAIASHTPLSKTVIKSILKAGGVWIRRSFRRRERRIRHAKRFVYPGDRIEVFYDPSLLKLSFPEPILIADHTVFTVWFKPAGVLSQGTKFGDHGSLLRYAAQKLQRSVFLVHRLDRETSGLMVIAHTQKQAAYLSALFRQQQIKKVYRAEVWGNLADQQPQSGSIDIALDGKEARTFYTVDSYDETRDTSLLTLTPQTGRLHQIRRHLHLLGHPIVGDQRYGGKPSPTGLLHLTAVLLAFRNDQEQYVEFTLSEQQIPWRNLSSH